MRMRGFCLAAAILLAFPTGLFAQFGGGKIVGQVQDDTGGVLPGVLINIRNLGTGLTRETTTNESGRYEVRQLPPGTNGARTASTRSDPPRLAPTGLPIASWF